MKNGGGKRKGSAFEREICVALSLWVSKGKRKDLLWRSAMSGGRATVTRKRGEKNTTQTGDITAVHPDGNKLTNNFVIECKKYKDLDVASGLLFGRGRLAKFWAQAYRESHIVGKMPLLIAKQNNMESRTTWRRFF
jgi:hypothetical protein